MGVRRLGVVDERHALDGGHAGNAVSCRDERAQPVANGGRIHPERASECRRREGVRDIVRGRRIDVVDGREFLGRGCPIRDECSVDEDVLDDAEHRQTGCTEREADRAATLDDIGLLDHGPRAFVLGVVDGRDLGSLVDSRLGRDVVLEASEVVDVVIGDIQAA
ncbi:unannotated protein [freshwater metagenome]|uniref:Unannotated protein n=1 Tax=freshwater metagenome TaxID=449393 RepID=A0A6J7HD83_9ZZZZ